MKRMPMTTRPGFENRNQQTVIRATDLAGTDHLQRIYVLRCGICHREYGANGSDIHIRRCPFCQGGKPGLPRTRIRIDQVAPVVADQDFDAGFSVGVEAAPNQAASRMAGLSARAGRPSLGARRLTASFGNTMVRHF